MALRCVTLHGESIEAGNLTEDEWNDLNREPTFDRILTLPCCAAEAVFRTSRQGTRYFAHHRRDICSWKQETEAHRLLKATALKAARNAGWTAQTEVTGIFPDGATWFADVLAENDNRKFAIEIEWPRQDNEQLWGRHRQYEKSGISAVWLLRQPGFPVSPEFPAACIGGDIDDKGLEILMPDTLIERASQRKEQWMWEQVLKPKDFFDGVFDGRVLFGLPAGITTQLRIRAPWLECPKCGKTTRIVMYLQAKIGPHGFWNRLDLADDVPRLRERIRDAVAGHPEIGDVKWYEGKGFGNQFMANWCVHCGALIDSLDEHSAYGSDEDPVAEIDLELDDEALAALEGKGETWAVWDEGPHGSPPQKSS